MLNRLLAPLALVLGVFSFAPGAEAQYVRSAPTVRVLNVTTVRPLAVRPLAAVSIDRRALLLRSGVARRPAVTRPAAVSPRVATPAPAPAPSEPGLAVCAVTENGGAARGATVTIRSGASVVATGDCSSALELPAGRYSATVTLTSALDRPTQTVAITVPDGGTTRIAASFSTALLEVRFTDAGAPVHGRAAILRNGVEVGSLGSNVVGRVSTGSYTIEATYRTSERTYSVDLSQGQRRAIQARF